MSRRTTGWVLLASALVGAAVVAVLGAREGRLDAVLLAITVVAVAAAALTVVLDRRGATRPAPDRGSGAGTP